MMRVTIAGVFFYIQASEVEQKMSAVEPEPIDGESVLVGTTAYPVKQVGRIVTGQDPRDFSTGEMVRALRQLGFTCKPRPASPEPAPFL
ncbi:SCO5918 family protein [Streptomyces pinistramenti]|uniref:SCO5918 family protein n=1 Tax=Streptomyces pinistramenti TaxID=2884812 RepID=UPI0027E4F877|nr:SCO5918 family protein [Streptomyces pinistramenti]